MINSPTGYLTLTADENALTGLFWGKYYLSAEQKLKLVEKNDHAIFENVETQLKEYFEGQRKHFDIPLAPQGTEFQKKVWQQLLKIPYGQYITYGEQANRLGNSKASRAVGAANGKNPIGILIPCHRVVASSGNLTGFAGGIENKKYLLDLESQ